MKKEAYIVVYAAENEFSKLFNNMAEQGYRLVHIGGKDHDNLCFIVFELRGLK
jgi:hypothetical protein